jgi:hypothetical protein
VFRRVTTASAGGQVVNDQHDETGSKFRRVEESHRSAKPLVVFQVVATVQVGWVANDRSDLRPFCDDDREWDGRNAAQKPSMVVEDLRQYECRNGSGHERVELLERLCEQRR